MLSQPSAGEQLVDSSEEAAIHYSRSCWAFYLEAAQNVEVTNTGWSVIPSLFFQTVPSPLVPCLLCTALKKCSSLAPDLEPFYHIQTTDDFKDTCLHVFNLDFPYLYRYLEQNHKMAQGKGPTGITESNSWLHAGLPKMQTQRALSKSFLNSAGLGPWPLPWVACFCTSCACTSSFSNFHKLIQKFPSSKYVIRFAFQLCFPRGFTLI